MEIDGTVTLTLASYEMLKEAGRDSMGQLQMKDTEIKNILRKLEFYELAYSAWTRFLIDPTKKTSNEEYVETLEKVTEKFNQKGTAAQFEVVQKDDRPLLRISKQTTDQI